jgi:hypothetical protein
MAYTRKPHKAALYKRAATDNGKKNIPGNVTNKKELAAILNRKIPAAIRNPFHRKISGTPKDQPEYNTGGRANCATIAVTRTTLKKAKFRATSNFILFDKSFAEDLRKPPTANTTHITLRLKRVKALLKDTISEAIVCIRELRQHFQFI